MDAITICAVNYLPFAHVLGNSFLQTNPKSTFSILVIDSKKISFQPKPEFKYFSPDDLNIENSVFENMSFYYDVTELATALKPSALKMLMRSGSSKVIYLDPDIQVFSELKELETQLDRNSIVLTPHNLYPIPRDGLRPTESDIMASGGFNLGFIGLAKSENTNNFLDWWEERLRFDSISDPEEMLFTDQRWIDLVPSYFAFHTLRDPSYNVAYWNLHERDLRFESGNYFVGQKQLSFFHFSGYRPETPWILSKYVSNNPRAVISKSVDLRKIFAEYGTLVKGQGWSKEGSIQYGYAKFSSGRKIPSSLRRLYREDCINAFRDGREIEPPKNWQEWATSRSAESGYLSRILFSLWKSRPDLKRRYPDATGTEAKDLQIWAKTHGVKEDVIEEDLVEIGSLIGDKYPNVYSKDKGINIAGYLNGEFGLGQSARIIYKVALSTGLPVTPLNSNRAKARQLENILLSSEEKIYPLIISIVNADHFEFWINDIGKKRISKSKIIGIWAWETEDFPERMHEAFKYVDEIWAVSNFVKSAIQVHTKKPVFVFPTPIIKPENVESLDRMKLGIPSGSEFNLFVFDYQSVFNRKNPLGVVKAHKQAFPNEDGPTLVIKTTNGDKDPENREYLRYSIQDRRDIILIEDYLSRDQLTSLINDCAVYVSLHRSEGYGLTMAEAMALAKPVIATAYSGNLDFMDESNSVLVPFERVAIGKGSLPYLEDSMWAEPDLNYAAEMMKKLHENKNLRFTIGKNAQNSVLTSFDMDRAVNFMNFRVNYHHRFSAVVHKQLRLSVNQLLKIKAALKNAIKVLLKSLKEG